MKKFQKHNKKDLIKSIRYSEDIYLDSDLISNESQLFSKIKNSFLMNHLPINEKLVPNLHNIINQCLKILEIDSKKVFSFVYNSSEMNAKCCSGLSDDVIIAISSSIVKSFSNEELKFIIGHELGHYLFSHSIKKSSNNLESLTQNRAKEITADRVGLLCCQSIDSAISAIIKILSGLNNNHINFDINSFLSEFKEIDTSNIPMEEIYSTHPPLPIRSKALLLFSMGSSYLEFIEENSAGGLSQCSIDAKVTEITKKYLDSRCSNYIDKNKNDFQFWALSLIYLKDGLFDKKEQQIMENLFGKEKINKLINLINSTSKEDVIRLCSKNCESFFSSYFKEAPKDSILYLKNFNEILKNKISYKDGLSEVLRECPNLKKILENSDKKSA